MKKNKIENITAIMTYIQEQDSIVSWAEIIQYCIDFDLFKELYLNHFLINHLIVEHNELIKCGEWVKPN